MAVQPYPIIACWRCGAELAPKTRKPSSPYGSSFTLTANDYIVHACLETVMSECWVWRWAVTPSGYPHIGRRGVHRLVAGASADGTDVVMHLCDNPPCVRPSHLRIATQRDNVRDALNKRRLRTGDRNHLSKLTADQVVDIRAQLKRGVTLRDIARAYGVSDGTIGHIASGRNWKHD